MGPNQSATTPAATAPGGAKSKENSGAISECYSHDEAVHGPDHPDVAASLNNLALILRDLGQPGEARPLLERALAIDEAVYGPDHPEVATDLDNLAMILEDLGQPGTAQQLQERAQAIAEVAQSATSGHPGGVAGP